MSSFELVGIQTRILLKSEINSANAVGVHGLDSSKSRVKVQQPHCSDSTVQHNRLIHADLGHSFCMPPRPASRRTLARFLSNVSSWDCHELWLVSCVLLNKERASLLAFWLDVFRCLEMSTEISRDVLNCLELSWAPNQVPDLRASPWCNSSVWAVSSMPLLCRCYSWHRLLTGEVPCSNAAQV